VTTPDPRPLSAPLTKAQIIERDVPSSLRDHPLYAWIRHGDWCPARRMTMDMTAVDGPCDCGLYATLDAEIEEARNG
jgi:hypothetical protein